MFAKCIVFYTVNLYMYIYDFFHIQLYMTHLWICGMYICIYMYVWKHLFIDIIQY